MKTNPFSRPANLIHYPSEPELVTETLPSDGAGDATADGELVTETLPSDGAGDATADAQVKPKRDTKPKTTKPKTTKGGA